MAVTLTISPAGDNPLTQIQSTLRSVRTVNAIITPVGDDGETMNVVSAVLLSSGGKVVIIPGTSSVSIVGTYDDPFLDTFQFVSKGSSNLIETPTTVVGVSNVPPKKELFNLSQDVKQKETINYEVTVEYQDQFFVPAIETFAVTHDIINEYEGIRSFMDTYYN
jgi:hypothetical protein